MKRHIRKIAQRLYKLYKARKKSALHDEPNSEIASPPESPTPPQTQTSPAVETPPNFLDIDIVPSPNPNACKYEVSVIFTNEAFSFSDVNLARDNPLALALLSLEGVHSIFGFQNFITVKKHPQAQWIDLHPQVEALLQKSLASLA